MGERQIERRGETETGLCSTKTEEGDDIIVTGGEHSVDLLNLITHRNEDE